MSIGKIGHGSPETRLRNRRRAMIVRRHRALQSDGDESVQVADEVSDPPDEQVPGDES